MEFRDYYTIMGVARDATQEAHDTFANEPKELAVKVVIQEGDGAP